MIKKILKGLLLVACGMLLILGVSIALFFAVKEIMDTLGYNTVFKSSDVIGFYGTIVAGCATTIITAGGLYFTLKQNNINLQKTLEQNNKNLERQKQDLEEDYKRNLNIKFLEISNSNINNIINIVYDIRLNVYNLKAYYINNRNPKLNYGEKVILYANSMKIEIFKIKYFINQLADTIEEDDVKELNLRAKDINDLIEKMLKQFNERNLDKEIVNSISEKISLLENKLSDVQSKINKKVK